MSFCAFEIHSHMPEKKNNQGFRLKTSMCVGCRFCGEYFWVTCDPLPYSDICLLFPCLSAFFTGVGREQNCLCYNKHMWHLLLLETTSYDKIFTSQLQPLSAVAQRLLSSLFDTQLFGFPPNSFGFWLVSCLWSETRQNSSQHFLIAAVDFGDIVTLLAVTTASGTCSVCWVEKHLI